MSNYIVGDIHGCNIELQSLLQKVNFSTKSDKLWLTGDLIFRGPSSLEVLRFVYSIRNCVKMVLGNHDINLLKLYHNIKNKKNYVNKNNILKLLHAPDIKILINWLRKQPLLQIDNQKKLIMVHAGIYPKWNIQDLKKYAKKIHNKLSNDNYLTFLQSIPKNLPDYWNKNFTELEKLYFAINIFTKMRYCYLNGKLDSKFKNAPKYVPKFLKPWFSFPININKDYIIIFGHWASLEKIQVAKNIFGLDTGCCWGNYLSMLCIENNKIFVQKSNKILHNIN